MAAPEAWRALSLSWPQDPASAALLLLVITIAPPLLFAAYLRNAERYRREPWRAVLKAFAWGATAAVFFAILAQTLLAPFLEDAAPWTAAISLSLTTVVLAPVSEELAKALGLLFVKDADPEPEDGFIYGGALGLGFAATENVLYVGVALVLQGQDVALYTAIYRGVVTVALHGAASAIAGYGIWRTRYGGGLAPALAGVTIAILLHGVYNWLVSGAPPGAGLLAALGAVVAFWRVRRRVKTLDRAGAPRWS